MNIKFVVTAYPLNSIGRSIVKGTQFNTELEAGCLEKEYRNCEEFYGVTIEKYCVTCQNFIHNCKCNKEKFTNEYMSDW